MLFSPTSVTIASVGDIAQLGEHPLDVRKVTGSNPVISTETAQQSGFFVPEKQKYSDHPMDWTALSMVLSQVQEEYHE